MINLSVSHGAASSLKRVKWLVFRVMVAAGLSPVLATPVFAFELAGGFGAVEQGDDRLEPAAALHLGYNDFYASNIYYWGREYGPVTQATYLATFVREWGVFKSNSLSAHFGVCAMNERITIKYTQDAYKGYDETKDNYNGGFVYGIAWGLPKTSPLSMRISWDSHLFPAGPEGTIFLVTGRKQTVTMTMGVAL